MNDSPSFEAIANFRDFGGFAVPGGGRVRLGRLLRSASLSSATPADLERLAAIGVAAIVDLRRPTERLKQPGRRPANFAGVVIESDDGDLGEAPHTTFLAQGEPTPEAVEAFLLDYYRQAAFLPRHRSLFSSAFAALDGANGALLIHCAAGKDRTGILAALIRSALGGHIDDTLDDFAITNRATMTPAGIAEARQILQAVTGQPPGEATVRAFLGVWPHHLEATFAEIDARCGSLDRYLDLLGVGPARRARLARALVV